MLEALVRWAPTTSTEGRFVGERRELQRKDATLAGQVLYADASAVRFDRVFRDSTSIRMLAASILARTHMKGCAEPVLRILRVHRSPFADAARAAATRSLLSEPDRPQPRQPE